MARPPLLIGAASRPHQGEEANGDGWAADWHGDACRIAVVDGLGHGPAAAAAAQAALAALTAASGLGPEDVLAACHSALAATRGAAMSVARIDMAAGRLTFAGVGNVEARVWRAGRAQRLLPARGIVGAMMPRLRPVEVALASEWLLLLHTDGVSARFELDDLAVAGHRDPQQLAEAVLARWGRPTDDATVVVARPAPDRPEID